MRRRLSNGSRSALEELVERAADKRIAVLCVERSEAACHRSVILEQARELDPTLDVIAVL
jgi:hypothetical protein